MLRRYVYAFFFRLYILLYGMGTFRALYMTCYMEIRYSVYFLIILKYFLHLCMEPGKRALSDAWSLDTAQKPYVWQRLNPDGDRPSARMLVF